MAVLFAYWRNDMNKKRWQDRIAPYLFLFPAFIFIIGFSYYEVIQSVIWSFTDTAFGTSGYFIGLANYARALHDSMYIASFRNQIIVSVMTVFNSIFWPLLASELLYFVKNRRLSNLYRTGFIIPMMVPSIVIILMWKYLYDSHMGFNTLLKAIGLQSLTRNWLNDKSTALACVILIGFPFIAGMYFLIFHTALNALEYDMIEAAIIDGATPIQIVFKVQLPNLRPDIKTVFTLSLISSLSGFGNIFATTGGGPGYATMIPSMQIYNVAFGDGDFGYASALGVFLMVVVVAITLISRKFMKEGD